MVQNHAHREYLLNTTGVYSNQQTIVSAVEADIGEVDTPVCWSGSASSDNIPRFGLGRGCGLYLSILAMSGSL